MRSRLSRPVLSLALGAVLGGLLAATIYWTQFDARWLIFLGGVQFAAMVPSAGFAAYVRQQLQERSFDGRALCFEIAEADIIAFPEDTRPTVSMLKPFGCRFTVDAFGSAKASFALLDGLGFDRVGVDDAQGFGIARPERLDPDKPLAVAVAGAA